MCFQIIFWSHNFHQKYSHLMRYIHTGLFMIFHDIDPNEIMNDVSCSPPLLQLELLVTLRYRCFDRVSPTCSDRFHASGNYLSSSRLEMTHKGSENLVKIVFAPRETNMESTATPHVYLSAPSSRHTVNKCFPLVEWPCAPILWDGTHQH